MNAALHTRQLQVQLGGRTVLQGVDLQIAAGRWTCVVGPNGAGKSTLLKALAGLLPHTGQVFWQGRALDDMPWRERALQLSWLGQGESSTLDLRVWDVAMLGRLPHQGWLGAPSPKDAQMVEAALKAGNKRYNLHIYPGTQHGFHNNSTPRYSEAAAKLSFEGALS